MTDHSTDTALTPAALKAFYQNWCGHHDDDGDGFAEAFAKQFPQHVSLQSESATGLSEDDLYALISKASKEYDASVVFPSVSAETRYVAKAIIDRLSTAPLPGGWRDGYDAAMRGTNERVGCYEREFYPLSNFSAFTLQWKNMTFDTSEAAYHWEKFPGPSQTGIGIAIREAPSAHEAFKRAERYRLHRRPDWDRVKLGIMQDILRAKAAQHEYVRRKLLETGSREIVEDSWRDDYWGLGPNGDGQNWLGKLWMIVRTELQAPSSHLINAWINAQDKLQTRLAAMTHNTSGAGEGEG